MGTWIEAADLFARYGRPRVEARADQNGDGVPEASVIATAIADAEGRVRSRLLTRFAPGDLPTTPGTASAALKRVCLPIAWENLWAGADIPPPAVSDGARAAFSELSDLVKGTAALLLEGEPDVDNTRPAIHRTSRTADPCAEPPITLERMRGWGR